MSKDNILYINNKNEVYKIDFLNLDYYLISEDGHKWAGKEGELSAHLDKLNSQHKFNSQYIIIENYQYKEGCGACILSGIHRSLYFHSFF